MAKCKECYHYLVCKFWDNDDKECSQFKATSSCVEVVRCKDCKWVEKGKDYESYCNHWKSGLYADVKDDDFCSYGERREGE